MLLYLCSQTYFRSSASSPHLTLASQTLCPIACSFHKPRDGWEWRGKNSCMKTSWASLQAHIKVELSLKETDFLPWRGSVEKLKKPFYQRMFMPWMVWLSESKWNEVGRWEPKPQVPLQHCSTAALASARCFLSDRALQECLEGSWAVQRETTILSVCTSSTVLV